MSIQGTSTTSNLGASAIVDIFGSFDRTRLTIGNSTTTAGGTRSSAIAFYSMNANGTAYKSNWEIGDDLGVKGSNDFYIYNADLNSSPFFISATGNVCIGTTNPQGYLLAVNGSAIATSVTVELNANWPDYVFKSDYKLPSLQEIKTYIDKNQHLPDMPSAEQVVKEGINLGEMNKLLTKKIEELTLYMIDEDKVQKELKDANKQQAELLKAQQEQINKLSQQLDSLIKNSEKK